MREDFERIRQQISVGTVADYLLQKDGRLYKYPGEKTASIRIYPETQSFYDYGRGHGGDCIALWSHVKGVDSWTALCQIRETFNLNTPNRANSQQFQAWSREIIRSNQFNNQKKGSSTNAQKEKKNQAAADILRARH